MAFTWFEFIFHPENPDYIIELPMTKAVVKGMDAVTEFVKQLNVRRRHACGCRRVMCVCVGGEGADVADALAGGLATGM